MHSSEVIEINDDECSIVNTPFEMVDNKPRKFIFCVDISAEMSQELKGSANTGIGNSNLYHSSRMETTQRFLKRYANMNTMIGNRRDEYALITLSDNATWWYGFDPDVFNLNEEIGFLDSQVQDYNTSLDAQSIFNEIGKKIDVDDDTYFYHVIVIYARTDVVPHLNREDLIASMRNSPNFVLDVVFLHESTSNVQKVYDFWNSLDSKVNEGWYYESGSALGKDRLTKALVELIAHPLQRGDQELLAR